MNYWPSSKLFLWPGRGLVKFLRSSRPSSVSSWSLFTRPCESTRAPAPSKRPFSDSALYDCIRLRPFCDRSSTERSVGCLRVPDYCFSLKLPPLRVDLSLPQTVPDFLPATFSFSRTPSIPFLGYHFPIFIFPFSSSCNNKILRRRASHASIIFPPSVLLRDLTSSNQSNSSFFSYSPITWLLLYTFSLSNLSIWLCVVHL